jgi:tetratricopeptide (TPR) repeat protein
MNTIASEISQQVGGGGADEDAERQYEMGMVYLEMGMFDQAVDCFASASQEPDHALRSFEMWGISLLRLSDADKAVAIFGRGLEVSVADEKEKLGLIYHLGRAHEQAGRLQEARQCYEQAQALAPTFLDVEDRLAKLAVAS